MDKLIIKVLQELPTEDGQLKITYSINYNGEEKAFMQTVSNKIALPLVLFKNQDVVDFINFVDGSPFAE